ncbi:MAG TPA: rhomboid family intramembrane serine protease [Geobacteraceae bacterium]|nr:rhomboid family intramembrane serine protease [Geobacteraceae bacterium]
MATLSEYFEQHEEQAFIVKAFLTIIAIIFVREYLSGLLALMILLFPVIFLVYIRMKAAVEGKGTFDLLKENITFIPLMYAEGERKREVTPWVTYSIILLDGLIFYGYEIKVDPEALKNLVFLPHDPDILNVPISAITSLFLHASGGHLWGNMIFLWMLGTVVERRVGHLRFAWLYLVTGLFGNLAFILVEFLFNGQAGHILGASGAIAGIMGIFAVRCYFKSMVFPIPILGIFSLILPISLKVRLNSLVIIGLFFLMDLSGGIGQIAGAHSQVGHWAHLGGIISGMMIAGLFLKLGEMAIEERHLEIGLKAAEAKVGFEGGEKSLAIALEKNPDNAETVLAMARIKTKFNPVPEGKELYEKAMKLLIAARPQDAVEVYKEYYQKYLAGVEPQLMYRLAVVMERGFDMEWASRAYEMLLKEPGISAETRQRALYQEASLLEKMGHDEAAASHYRQFVTEFPDAPAVPRVRSKLGLPELPPPSPQPVAAPSSSPHGPAAIVSNVSPVDPAAGDNTWPSCPACESRMIRRKASGGPHAGKLFWVCAEWPQCRKVLPVEG